MPGISFEDALNPEQLAAVQAPDGPILVLAAAGTGKTRTLVYRVAFLAQRGVAPEGILLLTFTNRAAREMLERAATLTGGGVSGIWGGTFHHMANRILRRYASLIGFGSDYAILDRDDSRSLVTDCVRTLKLKGQDFPKPAVLLAWFSAAANTEAPLERVIEERLGSARAAEFVADPTDIVRVHRAYGNEKRRLNSMDFDDLLVQCLRLFREHAHVCESYQQQFRHVLVDEYQDTNTIQAELVDRLAAGSRNVLVVGDDFQSIYSWRGADYTNILSFPQRYPDARVFKLETNYRSVPESLAVANACIAGNPHQFQKTLRATREPHERPRACRLRDGEEQARWVANQVLQFRRDGYRLSDIAVLYRAHFHALELERELARMRIPYLITSGVRFFEQAHIKDVCAILRVLVSPTDEMAFLRLLRMLPGVGERTALKAWQKLDGRFDARQAEQRERLRGALPQQARGAWAGIEEVLDAYGNEGLGDDGGEVIHRFVEAFYEEYAANTFENFDSRMDDIQALILDTAKFESVETFLSDIALLTNLDEETDDDMAPGERDMLRLSTVHQAKGLEWPVVIILWATEGMFPSARSLAESADGEAEERRLFYVAVTRARDELCLCVPEIRRMRDGGVIACQPSRFVEEIPPKYVRQIRPGFV